MKKIFLITFCIYLFATGSAQKINHKYVGENFTNVEQTITLYGQQFKQITIPLDDSTIFSVHMFPVRKNGLHSYCPQSVLNSLFADIHNNTLDKPWHIQHQGFATYRSIGKYEEYKITIKGTEKGNVLFVLQITPIQDPVTGVYIIKSKSEEIYVNNY